MKRQDMTKVWRGVADKGWDPELSGWRSGDLRLSVAGSGLDVVGRGNLNTGEQELLEAQRITRLKIITRIRIQRR